MATFVCSGCGGQFVGLAFNIGGEKYCEDCYNKKIREIENQSKEFEDLLQYLSEIFGILQIPEHVCSQYKKLVQSGQYTYGGIKGTLYYIYDVCGYYRAIEYSAAKVKDFYSEAKKYFDEIDKIAEENKNFIDSLEVCTIKMRPPENTKRKPKYNIEDL